MRLPEYLLWNWSVLSKLQFSNHEKNVISISECFKSQLLPGQISHHHELCAVHTTLWQAEDSPGKAFLYTTFMSKMECLDLLVVKKEHNKGQKRKLLLSSKPCSCYINSFPQTSVKVFVKIKQAGYGYYLVPGPPLYSRPLIIVIYLECV